MYVSRYYIFDRILIYLHKYASMFLSKYIEYINIFLYTIIDLTQVIYENPPFFFCYMIKLGVSTAIWWKELLICFRILLLLFKTSLF